MLRTVTALIAGVALIAATVRTEVEDLAEGPLLIPPAHMKEISLGYHETIADTLWLRVIQDFDFCETRGNQPIPADDIPTEGKAREGRCKRGWVYSMIDAITELAPQFRQPYASGAMMMSVIVDDIQGASAIFEKGLKQFPNDWQLLYRAAYHSLYETGDSVGAAKLLIRAGENGAPPWVFALAGKLYTKAGQAELAKSILTDLLEKNPEGPAAIRLRNRLREAELAIQKGE